MPISYRPDDDFPVGATISVPDGAFNILMTITAGFYEEPI
jgi:hypothetical protein